MPEHREMTPEAWREIESIFDRAMELDTGERDAFLDRECPDPWLRREVDSLMDAARASGGFLEQPAAEFAGDAIEAIGEDARHVRHAEGDRIGLYRIVRVAGRGGMSVVYLAERDDGVYTGPVALKVLNHPGRSEDMAKRFAHERQILASLAHPNIARIFDGGVTDEGLPYLVMEYVEGASITRHCAERALGLRERLRLFLGVCEAVQHAHERLVVHRDLKPSNVMVDTNGRVRLLDFGIAKLIDPVAGESLTGTGIRLMTPEYAAPEQVRGRAITTATDVYALGVMLYELLAGHRPYRLDDKTPAEMERIVCEVDPSPPSTGGVHADREAPPDTAALDEGLRRQVRGDLDTICLKALSKDPDARYGSARQLAEDLQRYLDGHPVLARPASAAYRVKKFVKRNQAGVAMGGLALALLLAFAVSMTVQQVATARARAVAEREAAKAHEVSAFLVELFDASDPYRAGSTGAPSAAELLDRGMERVEAMQGRPDVQVALLRSMGEANIGLGRFDRAESLLTRAVGASDEAFGERSLESALARDLLGTALKKLGRYGESAAMHSRALAAFIALRGEASTEAGRAWGGLGTALHMNGDLAGADSALTRSLEITTAALGENDAATVDALNNLGALRFDQGDHAGAYETQLEVYRRRLALYGGPHPKVAESLTNLGFYQRRLDNPARAESLYREAVAMKRLVLPADHPSIATTLDNLGVAIGVQGRFPEAEPVFREALEINLRRLGDRHPDVATNWNNLAVLRSRMGDSRGALEYQNRALQIRRETLGPWHPLVAASLTNLASDQEKLGRLDEAIANATQALAIERRSLGEGHPELAITLGDLGFYEYRRRNYREAERLHREALALRQRAFGEEHSEVATSLRSIALVQRERGDLAAARETILRALAIRRKTLGAGHPRVGECLDIFGVVEHRAGRHASADSLLQSALAIRLDRLPPSHPSVLETFDHLAANYEAWGRPADAAAMRQRRAEAAGR